MINTPLPRSGTPGRVLTSTVALLPNPHKPFCILSVAGGGTSVLAAARALAELENDIGWPLRRRFDLLAGTSAGSILILAIAAAIPMQAFADAWSNGIGGIFSNTSAPKGRAATLAALASSLIRSRHDGTALRAWLSKAWPDAVKVGHLPARVMVPAVDLTEGVARVLRSHHLPHHRHAACWSVKDLALASSAAPVFLPIHRAEGSAWADGGLFANSPDTLALMEAIGPLHVPLNNVHMLSMGSAWKMDSVPGIGPPLHWGAKDWARGQRILKTVMFAQQGMSIEHASHALGSRHWRWQARPTQEEARRLAIDSADEGSRAAFERMGFELWDREKSGPAAQFLAHHIAPKPVLGPMEVFSIQS